MSDDKVTSFRLPADLATALKQRADENGETVSDVVRRSALMVLGICPTCGQKAPGEDGWRADERRRREAAHAAEAEVTGGRAVGPCAIPPAPPGTNPDLREDSC